MKNIDIQPELLDIDRMKSKPYSKKEIAEISAYIKKEKEKKSKIVKQLAKKK